MTSTITSAEAARIMCSIDGRDWMNRDAFQQQIADDCKDEFAPFVRMLGFGPTLLYHRYCWVLHPYILSDESYREIFTLLPCTRVERRSLLDIKAYVTAEDAWEAFFEVVLA